MKHERAQVAAGLLAEAWRIGTLLTQIPPECRPRNAADGYQIQDELTAELDVPLGGWKIGCTSAVARRILKCRGPFAGRVLAPRIFRSGATLPGSAYHMRGLEGEFAFRLKKALPPRKRAYSLAEVTQAVGDLHFAIEIIDSRYVDWLKVGVPSIIADQAGNGALIVGSAVAGWRRLRLDAMPVRMQVNDHVVGEGTGADCMGHPLKALTWLANLLRSRGGLDAGAIVSTGTCSGFYAAGPDDRVVATFGRNGRVTVQFAR